jgi:hypothetical protein
MAVFVSDLQLMRDIEVGTTLHLRFTFVFAIANIISGASVEKQRSVGASKRDVSSSEESGAAFYFWKDTPDKTLRIPER